MQGPLPSRFQEAGFHDIATTALDAPFRLPSARHYLDFVRSSASPIQQILGRLDSAAAQAAWEDIEDRLTQFLKRRTLGSARTDTEKRRFR